MSDFDFTNTEEALENLKNQLEKAEQAYARKMLSKALGIDLDKLAALIEDDAACADSYSGAVSAVYA